MNNEFLEKLATSYGKQKTLAHKISSSVNAYFSEDKTPVKSKATTKISPKPVDLKFIEPTHFEEVLVVDEPLKVNVLPEIAETSFVPPVFDDKQLLKQEDSILPVFKNDISTLSTINHDEFLGNRRHASYDNIEDEGVADAFDDLVLLQENIDNIILGSNDDPDELKRDLHSLKSVLGVTGSKRGFELVHAIESAYGTKNSQLFIKEAWLTVYQIIDALKQNANIPLLQPLKHSAQWMHEDWLGEKISQHVEKVSSKDEQSLQNKIEPIVSLPVQEAPMGKNSLEPKRHVVEDSRISLSANTLEIWSEQVRIARQSQDATGLTVHSIVDKLDEMDDGIRKMGNMLRELEWHADSHLQARSRRHDKENFDPLEMDRFTRLQELTRQVSEGSDDIQEIRQDIIKSLVLIDEWRAKQGLSLSELDKGMAETRLKPMESVKARLSRSVKLAADYVGVDVSFQLIDNGVEIDRTLLDKIMNPLEHMLRNSVAHGIEKSADRIKAGKNSIGKITLECTQQAGHLIWVLKDDGRGVDVTKVKNKAVELGIVSKDENISMKDAIDLILKPSFSTANEVNDMSGRGVGMDVVRNQVVSMGGRFLMDSIPGKGTTTTTVVPSSSYSVPCLIVKAGTKSYALPNEIVSDFWLIKQSEYKDILTQNHIERNGTQYKFKSIFDILSIQGNVSIKARNLYGVLVKDGEDSLVIIVDRMVGLFDLTMLPLGDFWTTAPWIVGSVLLEDGVATFLINPLSMNGLRYDLINKDKLSVTSPITKKQKTILVVDDSLTVRKSTSRILKLSGYNVLTAKDGKEGFEMFSLNEPDLVITDVEMPRMDGFELLRSIRQGVKMSDVPVIIITSRTAQRHRTHAESLKANAYLGKPYKDDELLDNIKGFLK